MNAAVATVATLSEVYRTHRRRLLLWAVLVSSVVLALLARDPLAEQGLFDPEWISLGSAALLAVFAAALLCEYLDSSLGMGYGTTLTPLLLLAGFAPLQIVPAVLLSELFTGLAAGLLHHRDGNIDLRRDHQARRTFWLLATLSAVGAISAVLLAVRLSTQWFSVAIAVIVLGMGLVTLITARRRLRYRPAGILAIGSIAAFNKGLSGGGYGPLVTSGQVVSGVAPRQAVAITSMAEALTCLIGLTAYLLLGGAIDWSLALPLSAGALLSVPLATVTVRRLPEALIRGAVGVLTLTLGALLAFKLLL
ncbi:sulfite exporter TauE/SafE family protein [Marichromatium gracile]|uniref:Probable membrane transporter protein n=1 Tax=Marichromatium gracile TaxID=1048 RepID=A0A4R4ABK4_MARGR|nr:sulfite exporter TauE/SafE family protein [Marichromatium gracile]MBK1709988.1 hypothetical protein [Marichromatium gracile]TCW36373.1 hypothetical protein EDC29_104161 [Marichromatium gracile]